MSPGRGALRPHGRSGEGRGLGGRAGGSLVWVTFLAGKSEPNWVARASGTAVTKLHHRRWPSETSANLSSCRHSLEETIWLHCRHCGRSTLFCRIMSCSHPMTFTFILSAYRPPSVIHFLSLFPHSFKSSLLQHVISQKRNVTTLVNTDLGGK